MVVNDLKFYELVLLSLIGISIVFIVLIVISLMIFIMSKIVSSLNINNGKKKETMEKSTCEMLETVPMRPIAKTISNVLSAGIEEESGNAMLAAISEHTGIAIDEILINEIEKIS